MKNNKKQSVNYGFVLVIALITLAALFFRIKCCYWGRPLQLHPDEDAVVDWTIEMLSRHSWEAHFYDRPDHFEMKFDAIIFTVVSWLKYHKPAYEAFEEHRMAFYMMGRAFTALFGTMLVPLTALYAGRLAKGMKTAYRHLVQVIAASFVAFSSLYVKNSAFATPDIVLTFLIVLFAYGALCYLEDGKKRFLYMDIVIIGAGITLKYPAAILCLPLALMVILRAGFVEKGPLDIVKYAFISIGLILVTVLVMAPNLITDFGSVYTNVIEEARPNHLGADGLGFFGNAIYYLKELWKDIGLITVIPFISGIVYIIKNRGLRWLSLLVGAIYWLCMCVLSLHWVRWGIPMFAFYMIVTAVGLVALLDFFGTMIKKNVPVSKIGRYAVLALMSLLVFNVFLAGLSTTKERNLTDTRVALGGILAENGITEAMCLYEGYTPFAPSTTQRKYNEFTLSEDGTKVTANAGSYQYLIMSDSFKVRYINDREKYPHEAAIYEGIEATYDVTYRVVPDGNYATDASVVKNIVHSLRYLVRKSAITGTPITVYDLQSSN